MHHTPFIHRCLTLAERGRGKVCLNPLVGAVLVRNGRIIAEAFHAGFGKVHAERQLLENLDQKISTEDILYVNLEPCCHQGKTPACIDIIRERGVKNVVFGMIDPDPLVQGKGIECLRNAGIEVIGPVERARSEWLNRGFVSLRAKGRPWVTLKASRTIDGRTANADGTPLKISSGEQDRWAHEWLRGRHDAILVGVQTVMNDDPQLTNRSTSVHTFEIEDSQSLETNNRTQTENNQQTQEQTKFPETRRCGGDSGGGHRRSAFACPERSRRVRPFFAALGKERTRASDQLYSPLRIILDPQLRIPLAARVVSPDLASGTMVVTARGSGAAKREALTKRGVRVVEIPLVDGSLDLPSLWKVLTTPSGGFHGIASILIEGGARTWRFFRATGITDEEVTLMGM